MARVNASLKDVSTKFEVAPAGDYEFKVVEIQKPTDDDYIIISAIDEQGSPEYGKKVYDRFSFKKKDGGENRYGKAQLKRYFEAIVGEERANADDLDTDELLNGRFRGQISVEEWESKTKKDAQGNPAKGKSNSFETILPL